MFLSSVVCEYTHRLPVCAECAQSTDAENIHLLNQTKMLLEDRCSATRYALPLQCLRVRAHAGDGHITSDTCEINPFTEGERVLWGPASLWNKSTLCRLLVLVIILSRFPLIYF